MHAFVRRLEHLPVNQETIDLLEIQIEFILFHYFEAELAWA